MRLPGHWAGRPRGDTRVCTLCWARLALTQDLPRNGAFLTTFALAHLLRDVHPHLNDASEPQSGTADNKGGSDSESD